MKNWKTVALTFVMALLVTVALFAAPAKGTASASNATINSKGFAEEIVIFSSEYITKGGSTINATISRPNDKLRHTAVLLISDKGLTTRNDAAKNGDGVLQSLADSLNAAGISVFRYDERGVGKSTGNARAFTTDDLSKDAESAFDHFVTSSSVKKGYVGIVGIGEGATIANAIAARNKNVAFVVAVNGPKSSNLSVPVLSLDKVDLQKISSWIKEL